MFKLLLKEVRRLQAKGWGRNTISIYLQGFYEGYLTAKQERR